MGTTKGTHRDRTTCPTRRTLILFGLVLASSGCWGSNREVIERLEARVTHLESANAELQGELSSAQSELEELKNEVEQSRSTCDDLSGELDELRSLVALSAYR